MEHCQKFLELAKAQGFPASTLEGPEHALTELKSRLTPHFIAIAPPETFNAEKLKNTLLERLSPPEYQLLINPLDTTPEMKEWAKQITKGADGELEKAKKLFDALTKRIDLGNEKGHRTVIETFKDWNDPKATFLCEEYTFLYVALAREAGLRANYVLVNKDCRGRFSPHACAGVFIGDEALLVDPAFLWFGAPHDEYQFKSDWQAVGIYMSEFPNDINRARIAVKLIPGAAGTLQPCAGIGKERPFKTGTQPA